MDLMILNEGPLPAGRSVMTYLGVCGCPSGQCQARRQLVGTLTRQADRHDAWLASADVWSGQVGSVDVTEVLYHSDARQALRQTIARAQSLDRTDMHPTPK
jgi:hypothetical protein